jgi:hypothetical protein
VGLCWLCWGANPALLLHLQLLNIWLLLAAVAVLVREMQIQEQVEVVRVVIEPQQDFLLLLGLDIQ